MYTLNVARNLSVYPQGIDRIALFFSVSLWCLDNGYKREFDTVENLKNTRRFYISMDIGDDANDVTITTCCEDLINNIKTVWNDYGGTCKVHTLVPKFEYCCGEIIDYYSSIMDWLDQNVNRDDYHIYYRGYARYISFRDIKDDTMYKLMFTK